VTERLLVLAAVAVLVAALIVAGRLVAARRLGSLGRRPPEATWLALGETPDGRPAVLAFSTPTSGICRAAQHPALDSLEAGTGGAVRVIRVDAAERPDVATAFGVLTVPCTVVLAPDGRIVAANQGLAPAERLSAQLRLA
jgi:thioredoxin 1